MSGSMFPFGPAHVVPFLRKLRARIIATVALLAGGFSWIVLYLAFLAGRFPWYQNLAAVLVTLFVVPAVVVVMWVTWGLSAARRFRRAFWYEDFP
jgi:Na+/proline symporter